MMRSTLCALAMLAAALQWTAAAPPASTGTYTGWFSCEKCTAGRVAKGDVRPSNPVCARKCIEEGTEAVFLSEQGKESLKVRDYAGKDDVGYYVEVTGKIDRANGTIAVESVRRLEEAPASCARPRSNAKK